MGLDQVLVSLRLGARYPVIAVAVLTETRPGDGSRVFVTNKRPRFPASGPCKDEQGVITEIALGSASLAEFAGELFRYMNPIVGFDTACSTLTRAHDRSPLVTTLGYSEALLGANFPRYMDELTRDELTQIAGPQAIVDLDVISRPRRDCLAVYRELLVPCGVSSFVTNVWHCRSGVLGIHLARTGSTPSLAGGPLEIVQDLLPVIRLGMALLASEDTSSNEQAHDEWWASAWGLSARERDAARMVARGFRNGEIAQLLRVSPNTIRNHLVSIFRKAEVSTRAELLFAMNSESPQTGAVAEDVEPEALPWRDYVAGAKPLSLRSSPDR